MERYFIDIDQTMTKGKKPRWGVIQRVRQLIATGAHVTIWSGGGERYVRRKCEEWGVVPTMMISKPTVIVDDNPDVFYAPRCRRITPEAFEKGAT